MKTVVARCGAPSPLPPLALAEASGCLRYANHEARAVDLARLPAERAARELLCAEPRAVAFVAGLDDAAETFAAARELRRLDGAQILMMGELFRDEAVVARAFAESPADVVISGGFDDVLPKLAGLFDATGRWTALPGVWVREAAGPRRGGKPIPFSFDLDLTPPADFSWVQPSLYERPDTMPLSASRGCPWTCDFCAPRERAVKYSFKSGDRIFTDAARGLEQQKAWTRLEFLDIMANGHPESLRRFAQMAREAGWPGRGVRWAMQAAPRPEMDVALLAELAAGGCDRITFGLETASDGLRARMGKPVTRAQAERVLEDARAAGIACRVTLISGHPAETEADRDVTRAWTRRWEGRVEIETRPLALEAPSLLWRSAAARAEAAA